MSGYQVTYYDEQEVGKNDYQVVKSYQYFFTHLNDLRQEIIWDSGEHEEGKPPEPAENFWETDDKEEKEALNDKFMHTLLDWDGKTRLVIEGRHPDNWGGAVRFVFKPKTWTAKLMWQ